MIDVLQPVPIPDRACALAVMLTAAVAAAMLGLSADVRGRTT